MSTVVRDEVDVASLPVRRVCRSVSRTHVGRVRLINEDRVFDDPTAGVWAVADGMGGHSGGDLAAQQIIDSLRRGIEAGGGAQGAWDALHDANGLIHARNQHLRLDAGATVVSAALSAGRLQIAWAGDSRAYRIDAGEVELLTHDHSVVQQLIDSGAITAAMADRHPYANVVTRALGIDSTIKLDSVDVNASPGRFLLCSDGLSRSLRVDDLTSRSPLQDLAETLLNGALARDGTDNISFVIIEID